ncbi:DEAD/DEAH box helicase [Lactobacillus delbrueckii subsp. bulgaricus]|uniref:DNA helicase n=1 Tax=Lactobacillus phage phiJB TaxID=1399941 RepID=UPI0003B0A0C1|nr:DEAD/DEAH box helicase [Lactobacillus delbrueckii]YP_008772031.1 DNA helicase [Lactobacillus phage phiJB]AGW43649.1 type III restriction protein res subunit [Lactobacillus phage phiJB]AYC66205.1 DEAD/DEAH box helicase [Lactobacillus delbrueckii subsp. bulgaricus]MBT9088045.1 DEAD/DEAH box helicase [Lactobacillus delbrueckii subsp. bulgaricus]MBT9089686.1 DEAD/DEAH box helicase [Lactobacillus delbrueckii subsp. bulgaricus]MBT9091321.1 DEAD/DEAH box helicase [Lactobacillus delbrueckii subsp.
MAYELRGYQQELITRIRQSLASGHHQIIVQSPPRTGKTVVMAEIARRTTDKGNRVCFIIHRKEVLEQAKATFQEQGVDPNLLEADMVQSLTRHVDAMHPPEVILIDEAHHALAKSYRRILEAFPQAYVLLFTATPVRTGRNQLDQIADDIIVGKSIKELTEQGFLAPFKYYAAKDKDVDDQKLRRSSTGDYVTASIEEAVSHKIYSHTVDEYLTKAGGKQAVVYTYSVEAANYLAREFNARGITAEAIDATTPAQVRDTAVRKFRDQQLKVLVNVNLFTEGIDLPNVDCVIMVRPTMSLALYMQFSMRCLNPRPGKIAVIIDQVGNWERFGLPNADRDWKVLAKSKASPAKSLKRGGVQVIQCPDCFGVVEKSEVEDNTCPLCGYSPLVKKRGYAEQKAQLVEIKASDQVKRIKKIISDQVMLNVSTKRIDQLQSRQEFQAYAKLHGYKPGWVWYMWNKKRKGTI